MKGILAMLGVILVCPAVLSQDTITLKDHIKLNVRVVEQTERVVRYRMADYEDGPVIAIRSNRIRKISYRNGYTDPMGYQNPRKSMPLGISAGFAGEVTSGGSMVLLSADYFVMPQIDLEASLGTSDLSGGLYFAAGPRFHINTRYSVHRLTPFTGVLGGYYYGDPVIQLPAGLQYITKAGLSVSLSINELISFESWQATFIELRAGWRFRL